MYYKTMQICNVGEMDRLCSKLVSFQLLVNLTVTDKHSSLQRNLYITNVFIVKGPYSQHFIFLVTNEWAQ